MSRLRTTSDSRVRLDEATGAVRSFFGVDLVEPPPAALDAQSAAAKSDDFLAANRELFKLQDIDLREVQRREGSATESVVYQQTHDGIPVYGAQIVVGLQKSDGKVSSAVNQVDYEIPTSLTRASATVSPDAAVATARSLLAGRFGEVTTGNPTLFIYRHVAQAPEATAARRIRAEMLAVGNGEVGRVYVVWDVPTDTKNPDGNWNVLVDATSNVVVAVRDRRRNASVKGLVFQPDPITTSGDNTLSSATPQATLNPQRKEVQLNNLDPPNAGKFSLSGTWCFCKDIESPPFTPPTTPTNFSFGAKEREFLSVMVYYWVDQVVDYLRSFNIPAFNNAVAARKIALDAQGVNGDDNSHFTLDAQGAPYLAFGEGGVPDAADAHVILHEYGHAMHWYMGTDQNRLGSEEGFGDFLAGAFLDRFNAAQFGRESVFPWDNNAGDQYSTDRFFNTPRKFSDANYPALGPHVKGSVLAATLWDLFLSLGGDSNDAAKRQAAADTVVHIYVEMLVTVANEAPVIDLGRGMISADGAINGGANKDKIIAAFARRGLDLGVPSA
jgi:zinc metalloprotease ZmpB